MANESPAPPLARRIPGAARGGPENSTVPVLPDALLERMQAAVTAARAARGDRVETGRPQQPARPAAAPARTEVPVSAGQPGQLWPPTTVPQPRTALPPVVVAPVPVATPAPPKRPGRTARSRGPRVAGVAALAVIVIAAGVTAAALSARGSSKSPGSARPAGSPPSPGTSASPQTSLSQAAETASIAARWVDAQVNHDVIVACDKAMCDALAAAGFPGRHLKHIWPNAPYPSHAQIIVDTPLVDRQFGSDRNAEMAPQVLARLGSGDTATTIRIIAPHGAAKLGEQLKANQRQLSAGGAGLLKNRHITASAIARKVLLAGRVDPRLIVVLTAVASVHPINIISFSLNAADTSPGIQYRTANLAPNDPAAHMSGTDYLKFLLTALGAEPGIYHPLIAATTKSSTGQSVFRITYSAPSPLNLLGG